jgi:type IV pilus assembly protein PilA
MFASAIQRLNDRRDAAGDAGDDAGFTLIELMVVLLILAILLAIAIPTFLGVTKSANDRAAQSNLNTALVNAKAYYQNQSQTYNTTAAAVAALSSAEPSLTFQAAASTSQNQISVFVPSATAGTAGTGVILAAVSKNGNNCWYAVDNTVQQTITDVPYVNLHGYTPDASAPGTFYGVQKNAASCIASTVVASAPPNAAFQGNGFPPTP